MLNLMGIGAGISEIFRGLMRIDGLACPVMEYDSEAISGLRGVV